MSLYQFIASNAPLKEVKNPYITEMSIYDMEKQGLEVDHVLLQDYSGNKDEISILVFETEEQLYETEIKKDNPDFYASDYTNKKYVSEVTWRYTEERAEKLLEYIKEHLEEAEEIELWNIWMDEVSKPVIYEKKQNTITIEDLKKLWAQDGFAYPECVIVKRK